jgi:hypothetical protein
MDKIVSYAKGGAWRKSKIGLSCDSCRQKARPRAQTEGLWERAALAKEKTGPKGAGFNLCGPNI